MEKETAYKIKSLLRIVEHRWQELSAPSRIQVEKIYNVTLAELQEIIETL